MENLEQEIWKDVLGLEGMYQVSNFGRVKSLSRKYRKKDLILKPYNHRGYVCVDLRQTNNCLVHRIVANAFIFRPKGKDIINHKDFNKANNHVSNLEWVTNRENCIHYYSNNPKTSKYVGVGFKKDTNTWRARIKINGLNTQIGTFKTEIEAHEAYQKKLLEL
jgi:hypothetical protein